MSADLERRAPNELAGAGVMMVFSGTINLLMSIVWFLSTIWFCVGLVFLIPFTIAFFELLVGAALLAGNRVPDARMVCVLGMIGALCNIVNPVSLLLQIVASVLLGRPDVQEWLNS